MRIKPDTAIRTVEIEEGELRVDITAFSEAGKLAEAQAICATCAFALMRQCSGIDELGVATGYVPLITTRSDKPAYEKYPRLGKQSTTESYPDAIRRVAAAANCTK